MEVKQIASIINDITSELLGEEAIQTEDLSNIVDIGTAIFNATSVDNYVRSLMDHIGKMVFVDRVYSVSTPSVLMDGWEYGAVLEKVTMSELPEATENESWELSDGVSYDPNIYYQPKCEAHWFSRKVTFEIPMSFTERQVKGSFSNATQMNAFMSMIRTGIENSLSIKMDALIMRTINNFAAETVYDDFGANDPGASSGIKAVNLLYKYNTEVASTPITASQAMTDPEFIRFASREIGLVATRMTRMSTLFNIEGKERFTPRDRMHIILLNDFVKSADAYLQSDTYHDEYTRLPQAEVVPYWQASGTSYSFEDVSTIDVKTASNHEVAISGVLGVIFDRDALGVSNLDRRVTSNYNPKGEFFNEWHKYDAGHFNSFGENFLLFYIADPATP